MVTTRLTPLERHLSGKLGRAVRRYAMIADGDSVLVGLSGGADSFLMLKLLVARLRRVRSPYALCGAHVRASAACSQTQLPAAFVEAVEALGVPFVVREVADAGPPRGSPCFRCSWLRRKTLFEIARDVGAGRIALGHHADDLAETALMNLFWHGRYAAMEPVVSMMSGRFVLVRPMIYVHKEAITRWRRAQPHDMFTPSCRREGARAFVRSILQQAYERNRAARRNVLRSLLDNSRLDDKGTR